MGKQLPIHTWKNKTNEVSADMLESCTFGKARKTKSSSEAACKLSPLLKKATIRKVRIVSSTKIKAFLLIHPN